MGLLGTGRGHGDQRCRHPRASCGSTAPPRGARALGYQARHRPGWGVGSWFVPVASLWIPYQSLADCLPRDHPTRRGLAWLPLAYYLGIPACAVALLVAAFFGLGTAPLLVPAVVSVLLAGFVGWRGWRFVTAVHYDHQSSVAALGGRGSGPRDT